MTSTKPNDSTGVRLAFPPSPKGSEIDTVPLEAFDGFQDDLEVKLPAELDAFRLMWMSVFSPSFRANFGTVVFPERLRVIRRLAEMA